MEKLFRVPSDPLYINMLGRAVYNFAYLEWIIIWMVEALAPGYITHYSSRTITSGKVADKFCEQVAACHNLTPELKLSLENCSSEFKRLVEFRNKLIHAHPYTAENETQQLIYQGPKSLVAWPLLEVETAAYEFDNAACEMNAAYYDLQKLLETK